MSKNELNFMDRHVNRNHLVWAFGIFGITVGLLIYFNQYTQLDGTLLFLINFPASLTIYNIESIVNNVTFGRLSMLNEIPIIMIPISSLVWAAIGFLIHFSVKFFTTETKL